MLWWWSIGADLGETLGWCVTQAAPFDKTHADTGGCRFVTASDQIPQQMTWGSGFPSFFPPARRRHITYWHTCKSAGEHSDTHLRGQRRGGRWDGGIKATGFNQLTENQPSSHIILVPFCCFNPSSHLSSHSQTHTHTCTDLTNSSYIPTVLFHYTEFPWKPRAALGLLHTDTVVRTVSLDVGVQSRAWAIGRVRHFKSPEIWRIWTVNASRFLDELHLDSSPLCVSKGRQMQKAKHKSHTIKRNKKKKKNQPDKAEVTVNTEDLFFVFLSNVNEQHTFVS